MKQKFAFHNLNSFGISVGFFSSFDSNKIHTILTSLNTVITALCPVPCKSYSWCDRSNRIKVPVLLYPSVYTTNLFVQYWKQVEWDFIIPIQFKIQVRFILKIFCIPDWSRSFRSPIIYDLLLTIWYLQSPIIYDLLITIWYLESPIIYDLLITIWWEAQE